MAQVQVSVAVDQATLDLFKQVGALIVAIKSGGGVTADVSALLASLPALIADVQALPAEVQGDKVLLAKTALLGGFEVMAALGLS